MIRAFIAIELAQAIVQRIAAATDELKQKISGIRWTPNNDCHLTLKFLGDIEETRVQSIGDALERELSLFPRFSINAKSLGVFPDAKRPRVLWIGVEGKPLAALAQKVDNALAPLGFEQEKRIFTPHLTVGRWRQLSRADKSLTDVLAKWQERDFGACAVHEVVLFQSILSQTGAEHRRLKTVRLGADTSA
jgi:2'-5' RNA ligase